MSEAVKWRGAKALADHLVPVGELIQFPDNPIDEQHVHAIAKSLRDFGQVRAVLTWENADEFDMPTNTIVAGHHVWRGAQDPTNSWTHVAAIPAHFKDREAAWKYLQLDNALTLQSMVRMAESGQMSITDVVKDYVSEEELDRLTALTEHAPELISIADIKINERSTRQDPADLIEHIAAQLRETGFMDEIVLARDGTILKGEAALKAAAVIGLDKLPIKRLDIDPDSPEALRIMSLDYASGKRAMVDDRAFAELLKNLHDEMGELEGTGYSPEMVANLMMISRTAAEIGDANQAMEWFGLPEYEKVPLPVKLTVSFDNADGAAASAEEARELFVAERIPEAKIRKRHLSNLSMYWPPRDRDDPHSLRFVGAKPDAIETIEANDDNGLKEPPIETIDANDVQVANESQEAAALTQHDKVELNDAQEVQVES